MAEYAIGIPLHRNDGTLAGFAVVDAADAARLNERRWFLDPGHKARSGKPYVRTSGGAYLHRELLGLAPGDPRRTDHINGDTLDNRRNNLRVVTVAQNAQNQGSRGGSSRHRGVSWARRRQKWIASAMLDGRRHHIGYFDLEDEAGEAAAAWRAEHMPFSADALERAA